MTPCLQSSKKFEPPTSRSFIHSSKTSSLEIFLSPTMKFYLKLIRQKLLFHIVIASKLIQYYKIKCFVQCFKQITIFFIFLFLRASLHWISFIHSSFSNRGCFFTIDSLTTDIQLAMGKIDLKKKKQSLCHSGQNWHILPCGGLTFREVKLVHGYLFTAV